MPRAPRARALGGASGGGASGAALSGTRIRERRLAAQVKQADLARAVGVSAAYLNLIEKNRRVPRPDLLAALAAELGVARETLDEGGDGALFDTLREVAMRDPTLPPELDRIEEFVSRFPGWAAALAGRQRRVDTLEAALVDLGQRMTQDPWLSDMLHQVLSAVTSLRSTAAILTEDGEIDPQWRARFHRTLADDSRRAADTAEALAAYLDRLDHAEPGLASPQDEVEAWLSAADWAPAAPPAPEDPALVSQPGLALAQAEWAARQADRARLPDADLIAALEGQGADALDAFALARDLDRPADLVMRRLAALPPGVPGLPATGVGLAICDAAGALSFRRPLPGFTFPRGGAACALWPLFAALASPGQPRRDRIEMAGRWPARFQTQTIARIDLPQGLDGPRLLCAQMLILPDAPGTGDPPLAVGPTCRICPHPVCPARREVSIVAAPANGTAQG
ncbi:helix-turn-helix domain-containing protein [Paracoccus sp. p3-h83]|uniref:helix-turn-helix domain-containing protein n=1 Tax=Paracoccus sp. p3-h83 TaxID=3342805 RepID=UPI0035B7AE5C